MRVAAFLSAICAASLALALAGCGTGGYTDGGSQGAGKQLFTQACGVCHTLADAGTAGTIGPNLDDAFAQARADGMTSDTFTQVVAAQIRFPIEETSTGAPGMPSADRNTSVLRRHRGERVLCQRSGSSGGRHRRLRRSGRGNGCNHAEAPTDGKSIFTASCGSCHTLADAGTTGAVGPNLDDAKPAKALVVDRVTNGEGAMPSFKDSLDPQQIEAVAEYVSSAAGK